MVEGNMLEYGEHIHCDKDYIPGAFKKISRNFWKIKTKSENLIKIQKEKDWKYGFVC